VFQIGADLSESARAQITAATLEGMGNERKFFRTMPKQRLLDIFQATGRIFQKGIDNPF
jgi:hypothetical protein